MSDTTLLRTCGKCGFSYARTTHICPDASFITRYEIASSVFGDKVTDIDLQREKLKTSLHATMVYLEKRIADDTAELYLCRNAINTLEAMDE